MALMPPNTATLRPAESRDREAIRALVYAVITEYDLSGDAQAIDQDLNDPAASYRSQGGRFDVLEENGHIVGCVGMLPLAEEGNVELRRMYLEPSARGRGHGHRLLRHALAWAGAAGFRRVTLETAAALTDAIALYQRCGFRRYQPQHISAGCDQAWCLDLVDP